MTDVNSVVIVGRLVKDAELKTFDSGFGVLNFTLATNRSYKKDNEWVEEASFVDCKYFSKGASKLSEYAKKGGQIAVSGSLIQESWTTQDGGKRSRLVVQADNIQLLGGNKGSSAPATSDGFKDCPF